MLFCCEEWLFALTSKQRGCHLQVCPAEAVYSRLTVPCLFVRPLQAIGSAYKAQAEIFLGGVLDGSLAALK